MRDYISFLVCDQRLSVGRCMRDYKSLCVAVIISLVNTHTHTDTHNNNL